MPPPSNNPDIEITNYDVLADQVSTNPIIIAAGNSNSNNNESDTGLSLAAHSYHVGNNRLEVLCNMHYSAFADSQAKKEEVNSASIVDKVMKIVQNQCVPKGRFLERSTEGQWSLVEPTKAKSLVRQALMSIGAGASSSAGAGESAQDSIKKQQVDEEKKRRRRSSLLRRSVSSSMLPNLQAAGREMELKGFDDKKKNSRKGSIARGSIIALSPVNSPDNSPKSSPTNSRSNSPMPPPANAEVRTQNNTILPDNPAPRPAFGRSHSVEVGAGRQARRLATKYTGPIIIKETLKMDVLLNTAKTALLPGADLHGNNRMRVMVSIQTMAYQSAKEEKDKTKMASELLNTIESFWGGRVLSIVPSMRRSNHHRNTGVDAAAADSKSSGDGDEKELQYIKLDAVHAIQAMKNLLSGKAADKEEAITQGATPDPAIKQGRRASLQAIESIAATGAGKGGGAGGGDSKSILPSTLPTLPPDMQHLRSAAVKSLQKRKQRQGLNSRIRGLTADKAAIYQDGGTNVSVMSGSAASTVANVAPIPTQITSQVSGGSGIGIGIGIGGQGLPRMQHYRQTSSGASVGSSVSGNMSYVRQPGMAQRQGSVCSTGTNATHMSMNTMTAARNMANINLNAQQPSPLHSSTMVNPNGMMPMLGSELHIPNNNNNNNNIPSNIMAPNLNQQQLMERKISQMSNMSQQSHMPQQSQQHMPNNQMQRQMSQMTAQTNHQILPAQMERQISEMTQQSQQMQQMQQMQHQQQMQQNMQQMQQQQQQMQQQFEPRQVVMPVVQEETYNNGPAPLSMQQLQQLAQMNNNQQQQQHHQHINQNQINQNQNQTQPQFHPVEFGGGDGGGVPLEDNNNRLLAGLGDNGRTGRDRNQLLNSTGSDGLPKFGQNEMELLMKGLEE